ncbi:MAG: hypothetical protein AMXMBFR23_22160 [Chloroflexota bacterium]
MPFEREHRSADADAARPDAPKRRTATGWLDLQQRAGNRATRALARAVETDAPPPGGPRAGRPSVRVGLPPRAVSRAWGAPDAQQVQVWDSLDRNGKRWKRKPANGGYEYSYSVVEGTMDLEHEGNWMTAAALEAANITVPRDVLGLPAQQAQAEAQADAEQLDAESGESDNESGDDAGNDSDAEPDADASDADEHAGPGIAEDLAADANEAEWDTSRLIDEMTRRGLPGICNALTAAYLLDFVNPTVDRSGMATVALGRARLLKNLLDLIVNGMQADSDIVTQVFVDWARGQGHGADWFNGLTLQNVNQRHDEFRQYFNQRAAAEGESDSDAEGDDADDGGGSREMEIDGAYEGHTADGMATEIDAMLEPWFDLDTSFSGVVVVKAEVDGERGQSGHEFAIRYDGNTRTFTIFDQNAGLLSEQISEQEFIADAIATHLMKYVARPMNVDVDGEIKPADCGTFRVRVF